MKILVLAWGSLIWDPGNLHIDSPFKPDGPMLPIEFCRISTRGDRLTLVINERHGRECRTYSARSALPTIDEALLDLWRRETRQPEQAMPRDPIRKSPTVAFLETSTGAHSPVATKQPRALDAIKAWGRVQAADAIVWTSLSMRFKDHKPVDVPFSVNAAMNYLQTLFGPTRSVAFEYIRRAPPEVQTRLRMAFNERFGASPE